MDIQYELCHNIFRVIHFVAIYKLVTYLSAKHTLQWLKIIAGISFFIYAFHEPWLGYIMKISFKVLHPSGIMLYLAPFAYVAIAIGYSSLAYVILKKITPRLLAVLTGSRG